MLERPVMRSRRTPHAIADRMAIENRHADCEIESRPLAGGLENLMFGNAHDGDQRQLFDHAVADEPLTESRNCIAFQ